MKESLIEKGLSCIERLLGETTRSHPAVTDNCRRVKNDRILSHVRIFCQQHGMSIPAIEHHVDVAVLRWNGVDHKVKSPGILPKGIMDLTITFIYTEA